MITQTALHRRKFIKAFTAAIIFIPYAKYIGANTDSYSVSINILEKFLANKQGAIHEIGKTYLAVSPNDADKEKLFISIFPETTGVDLLQGNNQDEKIRSHIKNQSYLDFQSGNIITVKGWKLAATEVHLCALSYLLSRS